MKTMPRKSTIVNIRIILITFLLGVFIGGVIVASVQTTSQPTNQTSIPTTLTSPRSATAHILAVSADTNEGLIGIVSVELVPGYGRVLISANPFIEPDTQESVAIARAVAENYTGISLGNTDVIASFSLPIGNETAQVVGGPSAGAALTIATIAAALNKSVRPDVAITGRILPDGTIGAVGGTLEKAQAAGEAGIKILIIPAGLGEISYYEKIVEQQAVNGFSITRITYAPHTLSLNNFTQQWNMTSIEVTTIGEAARYAIADIASPQNQ